ncbi:MAG: hypothetical protein AUI14_12045 [Actinobacteria bacterium 13_2_20CM_2_71_6]|nr:MAG: hypothetical protein AUI14_12045 [Actinobacteria bacterium 13_2_20CM_2_71_6]
MVAVPADAASTPRTVLMSGSRLVSIRQSLHHHPSSALGAAYSRLKKDADAALKTGPWAVTDKSQKPPSGDRHDYYSQAPYWWPGPQGCPYVQRDGERNPDVDKISDHAERDAAWTAIRDLALAWFYTGNAKYAQRAELDARVWFLNRATRMNPNMTFAQTIPCDTSVRGTGIIEASETLPQLLDGLAVLDSGAPGWTSADRNGMRAWLTSFLGWLRNSPQGTDETAAKNNHGTYKDLLDSSIAFYIGQTSLAKSIVNGAKAGRIDTQIEADGRQPLELARTRSWHYSNFNATALCQLAATGERLGVDLWGYTNPKGGSIRKAVDFLIPAAEHGRSAWSTQEIDSFDQTLAKYPLHAAAEHKDSKAAAAVPKVPSPSGGDMWLLEPAC